MRLARFALLALGLAFGIGAELVRLRAEWPLTWVVADFLPGAAFLVAGTFAWARRPANRIGAMMVATGFAWWIGTYGATMHPVVDRLAYAFQGYYDPFLAWLVLAFPTGHLRTAPMRVVAGAFFGVLVARSLMRLALYRQSTDYDLGIPAEVDRYVADFAVRDAADGVFRVLIAGIAVAVLVLVAWRLRTETAAGRRVALPILLGGVAVAIGVVVEVSSLAVAGSFAERAAAWDLGQALNVVTGSLIPIGFAAGVVRSRLARSSVADLVVELDAAGEPRTIRELLAGSLRDPSLVVAYPVDGSGTFVDEGGRPFELPPESDASRATTRLERGGATLAVLVHDPAIAEEPELVRSVTAAAGLALDNERLAAEVRRQLDEVRASRARIVAAGDAERRRVERDLHDGAQQRLVTLALTLQVARSQVASGDSPMAAQLDRAGDELGQALAELRALARGLHPTVLTEEGLRAAVEALADRSPVPVDVLAPDRRFAPEIEATAYFVAAEALTNVAKYAAATEATVRISTDADVLVVEVADDGMGGADPSRGSGLRGLDDRVAAIGGRLVIESPSGGGTAIRAELPCA